MLASPTTLPAPVARRTCALDGCGVTFPVRGPKRYCSALHEDAGRKRQRRAEKPDPSRPPLLWRHHGQAQQAKLIDTARESGLLVPPPESPDDDLSVPSDILRSSGARQLHDGMADQAEPDVTSSEALVSDDEGHDPDRDREPTSGEAWSAVIERDDAPEALGQRTTPNTWHGNSAIGDLAVPSRLKPGHWGAPGYDERPSSKPGWFYKALRGIKHLTGKQLADFDEAAIAAYPDEELRHELQAALDEVRLQRWLAGDLSNQLDHTQALLATRSVQLAMAVSRDGGGER